MYYVNIAAGEAAKKKGHANFPDDFERLKNGMETIIWADGDCANYIETTLCNVNKLVKQVEEFEKSGNKIMIFYDRRQHK